VNFLIKNIYSELAKCEHFFFIFSIVFLDERKNIIFSIISIGCYIASKLIHIDIIFMIL